MEEKLLGKSMSDLRKRQADLCAEGSVETLHACLHKLSKKKHLHAGTKTNSSKGPENHCVR